MNGDNEYYWIDSFGGINGPEIWVRLQDLHRQNIISDETKICVVGTKDWSPYKTVTPSPQVIHPVNHNDNANAKSGGINRPSSLQGHFKRTVSKRIIFAGTVVTLLSIISVSFIHNYKKQHALTFTDVYSHSEVPVSVALTKLKPDFEEVYCVAWTEIEIMTGMSEQLCKMNLDRNLNAILADKNISESLRPLLEQLAVFCKKLQASDRNLGVLMEYLKFPPEKYKEAKHALDEYYSVSKQLLSLANDPSGSMISYRQRIERAADASHKAKALVEIQGIAIPLEIKILALGLKLEDVIKNVSINADESLGAMLLRMQRERITEWHKESVRKEYEQSRMK